VSFLARVLRLAEANGVSDHPEKNQTDNLNTYSKRIIPPSGGIKKLSPTIDESDAK
jgi:hypothetical protein